MCTLPWRRRRISSRDSYWTTPRWICVLSRRRAATDRRRRRRRRSIGHRPSSVLRERRAAERWRADRPTRWSPRPARRSRRLPSASTQRTGQVVRSRWWPANAIRLCFESGVGSALAGRNRALLRRGSFGVRGRHDRRTSGKKKRTSIGPQRRDEPTTTTLTLGRFQK